MRFYYLDFSRSFLFFLGIVLHAAYLCAERDHSFQSVHDVIHSFRMEGFFLIAGFFAAMSLARTAAASFLRKRVVRLGIPFLFGALVLDMVVNCANHWNWSDFGMEFSGNYWMCGEWMEHLWFLPTLLFYTGVTVLAQSLWPRMDSFLRERRFSAAFTLTITCVLYFAAIHVARVIPWQTHMDVFLVTYKTEQYAVFFGLGYLLFHRRDLLERMVAARWLNVANIATYAIAYPAFSDATYGKYLVQLWHPAFCVSICGLLFFLARRFFDQPSPVVRSLSDSSYTVYLVHWPFMIIINRLLVHSGLGAPSTLVLLIVLTSVLSYWFHVAVVKRSPLFALLLNGQMPETRPREAESLSRAA